MTRLMRITVALVDDPAESAELDVRVNDSVPDDVAVRGMSRLLEDALREAEYEVEVRR